jgi:hypothetical protein
MLRSRRSTRRYRVGSGSLAPHSYRYSLRRGDEIVATGHFTSDRAIEIGEELTIGASRGVVVAVEPSLGSGEEQLTIELPAPPAAPGPGREAIARRAYELSLESDAGTEEENWLRAERELADE